MLSIFKNTSNRKISIVITGSVFIILLFFLSFSLNTKDTKHVIITDENGNPINKILAVPLYKVSFGIGFGSDGNGLNTDYEQTIKKPYILNSGDDLLKHVIGSRGLNFPPFVFIGHSNYLDRLLLIKEGFSVKLVFRADIYNDAPIVMKKSYGKEAENIIGMLLQSKYKYIKFKELFAIDGFKSDVIIIINEKDTKLMESVM